MPFLDQELFKAVTEDVNKALKYSREEDNQYNRRSYVRTVFSAIESFTYMLKSFVLTKVPLKIFSMAEIALLKEENYRLDSNGKATSYPRQLSVPENFRYAFEMKMREYDSDYRLDISTNGWRHLKNATKIRNRLTHPRNIKDIILSSHDMSEVLLAFDWITYNIMCSQAKGIEVLTGKITKKPGEVYYNLIEIISKYKDI